MSSAAGALYDADDTGGALVKSARDAQHAEDKVEHYATALAFFTQKYHEKHLKCAPLYAEYGAALQRQTQATDDVMGNRVDDMSRDKPAKQTAAQDAADADAAAVPSDATAPAAAASSAGPPAAADDDGASDGASDASDASEASEASAEEADDLELAFQVLDLARVIFEEEDRHGEYVAAHADARSLLGEIALENEQWVDAVTEFEKALELTKAHASEGDRELAHLHCQVASARVALAEHSRQEAVKHYDGAAAQLRARIKEHEDKARAADTPLSAPVAAELAELRELLAELAERSQEQARGAAASQTEASATAAPAVAASAGEGTTTIGFGASVSAAGAAPAPLAVRKKVALEPCNPHPNSAAAPAAVPADTKSAMAASAPPASKRVRLE